MTRNSAVALLALSIAACAPTQTSTPSPKSIPPIAREFRGVWVATVANIDWPSKPGLPADQQKQELLAILDRVQQMRMNAVVLQVRPAADALYASQLEPWSEYLTGKMGAPPSPYYDPLQFAVEEAHKRGLELHAWFNPYRAHHPTATSEISATHLSKTRPDIVRTYGKHLWMDPGEEDVRKHSLAVVLDVVKRYDVDGVHIDDYFYPYSENDAAGKPIPFPDSVSYARYQTAGGKLARDDWRRHNVDMFIEELYREVKETKPWVKFGISPFGIWRPGNPAVVKSSFDAYASLYADAKKWLNNGWLDYWTPQLYWSMRGDQPYPALLSWWVSENLKHRHVWPGNAPYRVRNDRQNWNADEIVEQIQATRAQPGASGNVHFSMRTFMRNQGGVNDAIESKSYTYFALPPRSTWLDHSAPPRPNVSVDAAHMLHIEAAPGEQPLWYGVRMRIAGKWYAEVIAASRKDYPLLRANNVLPDAIAITAVDRSGNESDAVVLPVR